MIIAINKCLDKFESALNSKLEQRGVLNLILVLYFLLFASSSLLVNLSRYSPDSWAYFELSKTIFTGNFYKFNTFRGYFSSDYSTSFPFGWPVAISLASSLAGADPLNAVYINIILATLTISIFFKTSERLKLKATHAFLICSALLLYRPYTNELLSGRSMPFAIFLFLLGFYLFQKNSIFFSGLFFGASALVRFDFLVFSFIFQLSALFLTKDKTEDKFLLFIGFTTGILPWVIYSYLHFNTFWVSDNSWVAASALPAFVVDYPATPIVSAFQDPIAWLKRVIGNFIPLSKSVATSVIYFPIFILLFFLLLINLKKFNRDAKFNFKVVFISGICGMSPYALTGYFDPRYFTLIFLIGSTFCVYTLNSTDHLNYFGLSLNSLIFLMVVATLIYGGFFLFRDNFVARNNLINLENQEVQIYDLYSCHKLKPWSIYIFTGEAGAMAPRYGAITGMPTAFLPSNFDRMTIPEKDRYFEHMQPFVIIDSLAAIKKCTN